jgi:hypothetical protein
MRGAVLTLFSAFGRICLFRIGPQDLPRSTALLLVATLANASFSLLIYQLEAPFPAALFKALLKALLEVAVLYTLTYALLFLMSYGRRFVQTMTALMGSGAILGAVALATMLLAPVLPAEVGLAMLRVNFFLNLLIIAHVLRHAVGTFFLVGLLFAFGYALLLNKFFRFADALLGLGTT